MCPYGTGRTPGKYSTNFCVVLLMNSGTQDTGTETSCFISPPNFGWCSTIAFLIFQIFCVCDNELAIAASQTSSFSIAYVRVF